MLIFAVIHCITTILRTMSNSYFRFRRFTINQDRCAMKVGTDGVLLGAWALGKNPGRILDVGTGTGLVALMMAQRFPASEVLALEIDHDAALQAAENAADSDFDSRVKVREQDYLDYEDETGFDLIVSNPPYFKDSLEAPERSRFLARQGEGLGFASLLERSRSLLRPAGFLALIAPYDQMEPILSRAFLLGYGLSRRLIVRSTPRKDPARVLLEFSREGGTLLEDELLTLHDEDGTRSMQFDTLTKDFYLNH